VRDLGGCGRMRSGALAGLVRVDAAPDAPFDGQPEHRSERRVHPEGAPEDQRQHVRQPIRVRHHDDDGHHDVGERHEWHHDLREPRDARDAADNDDAKREDDAG
jgi:hypothetical protein